MCKDKKAVNVGQNQNTVDANHKHGQIRASKIYGANDQPETIQANQFAPIKNSNVRGAEKQTRAETYAIEDNGGNKSKLITSIKQLDFALDTQPGVSNTFDIPTFDYHTILNHNIFSNLNSKIRVPYE